MKNMAVRSYFNWGLNELQARIEDRCEIGYEEIDVIEEFINDMNDFVCMAKSETTEIAFLSAVEAGEYARELYIKRKERKHENEPKRRGDKFIGWG